MLKILVKNKKNNTEKSYQLKRNVILLGRSSECDIVLESDTVSRKHAQIHTSDSGVFVEDLASGNGTLINQKKIPAKQKTALKSDDVISIEDFEIHWQSDQKLPSFDKDSPMDSTDPDILEIKMIKKVIGAMSHSQKPRIVFESEPFQNKTLKLDDPDKTYSVGREEDCDLSIDSAVISRRHAEIFTKWGAFVVKDLQSKNGTFVNGDPVAPEVTLKDGDEITFGTLKAVFQNPEQFQFKEIENSLQEEKQKNAPSPEATTPPKDTSETKPETPKSEKKEKPAEQKPEPKKQDEPKAEKPTETNNDDQEIEDILKEENETPKTKSTSSVFSRFTKLEWGLLGFGGLVLILLLVAIYSVF